MAAASMLREASANPHTAGEDEHVEFTVRETFHAASSIEDGFFPPPVTETKGTRRPSTSRCWTPSPWLLHSAGEPSHVDREAVNFPMSASANADDPLEEEGQEGAASAEPEEVGRAAADAPGSAGGEEAAADAHGLAGAPWVPESFVGSVPMAPDMNHQAALLADEECLDAGSGRWAHPEDTAALPSTGSAWHATGECRPCHHIVRSKRCKQGDKCGFCHFPEHVQRQQRPSKQKREQYRKLAQQMLEEVDANPEAYDHEQQALAPFLSQKIPKLFADNKQLMRKLNRRVQRQAWESAQKCPVGPDPWLPLDASPETWLQPMLEAGKLSQGGRIQQVGTWKVELLSF
mmetsp:Transcript_132309/g.368827  ORF Transcript_132309/g.368827 Transcript_132309/m.368827 type:complete len:347 (+) Transcript_132309:82-1122(+)